MGRCQNKAQNCEEVLKESPIVWPQVTNDNNNNNNMIKFQLC
jgi:hypothetical protein